MTVNTIISVLRHQHILLERGHHKKTKKRRFSDVWKQWKKDYHSAKKDRVNPLHNQHNVIKGQLEKYVVGAGNYKLGQVLDNVPADAVLADDFFMF